MKLTKHLIRSGLIALGLATAVPAGAAFAGEWRINARECPDLREDRYDRRHDNGWADRREDRRDERVINCPARAWYYVRSRGESRYYTPPRPRQLVVYDRDHGRAYYRDGRGQMVHLELGLRLG